MIRHQKNMGFLTLSGEEMLIPLDGQHRVKAFEFATTGKDEQGKDIPRLKPNYELGKDSVAVILMRFEGKTARRIFSKINRYAKPTNKGDNLITDDDDPMAVITRRLLGSDGVIPSRLVSLEGNTLNQKAREFTTLATFYEATKEIFNGLCVPGSGKITRHDARANGDTLEGHTQGMGRIAFQDRLVAKGHKGS